LFRRIPVKTKLLKIAMDKELEKQAVARASLGFVEDGQIVGLGTGSTAKYFIEFLGERVRAGFKVRGIPTSIKSQQLAVQQGGESGDGGG